jgi:ribosomal-protein-alanine N-acetyltransferase
MFPWADREGGQMNVSRQPQLRVHIRWMIRRDMPEVLDIERDSFEFPWYEEDFIRCLRQRNCIGMVAEHGERVVGFMIYELHKSRLHILNFAVSADVRRRGVGLQMADKLISKLSSQRRTRVTLEVRETNLAAQLFFRQNGFKATSVLREYYDDSPEDAYVMQYAYETEDQEMILPINRIDRLAG